MTPFRQYFQWNGNSVVDYLVTSASIFENITSLTVGGILTMAVGSLRFTLLTRNIQVTYRNDPLKPIMNAPKQFTWRTRDTDKFWKPFNHQKLTKKLTEILNIDQSNPNDIVDPLTEVLLKTADKASVKSKTHSKSKFSPWFDKTCTKMKNKIKTMEKKVRKGPLNQTLKIELLKLKRRLKKQFK